VRELVRALAQLDDAPRLKLFDVGPGRRVCGEAMLGLEGADARRLRAKFPRRALAPLGSLGLTADRLLGGCELFHGVLAGAPPVGRARKTIALAELPPAGSDAERALARGLRGYDGVFTFSAWGVSEIARRFELAPERVHSLPVGCEHWQRELTAPPERDDPPTVLVLGRVDHARAPLAILAACQRLRASGASLRLCFVGRRGDAFDELRARTASGAHSSSITFVSQPDESAMPALVARASVLVHLSERELSPVTPLEALAAGCAVVASRQPAFEEALGVHARWIDAPEGSIDAPALAGAIADALRDANDEPRARDRRALAARYTWSRHARLTLDAWRTILAR
jgi:glycosyltransferase involved in cell wall biosynthesis